MNDPVTVRIVYPKPEGRIVLRTDDDWDQDIEPGSMSDDGNCTEFLYRSEKPYFYFRPMLVRVMGSSLGGVVSFYMAWNYPHIFGKAACMSSSFNFKDDLLQRVLSEEKKPVKLYLDSGWPEDNYEVTRSMNDVLLGRGFQSGQDLLYFAFPHALHNERYWAMRSHIPFQFFFGKGPTS